MIRMQAVSKSFGQHQAVDTVSLRVNRGEIFGLVGPDGAGKTTTIKMLIGILKPSSGEISILDRSPADAREQLGYVPQKFSLYGDLTVQENIAVMGALYGANQQTIREKSEKILKYTNLFPFRDRLADNLSGGMKQKLALAAGLMHRPEIFFLDEPTTGVDPVSRREFWQMLYQLNQEGTTVFVSTPYMDEAELCHRIAFMHEGKIVSCDTPKGLKAAYPYYVLELTAKGKQIRQLLTGSQVIEINAFGDKYHLMVEDPETAKQKVRSILEGQGIPVLALREITPTLEDVFVALASEVTEDAGG